ncbi:RimJ/RimL family protein N-acetyltransferase [Salirhabdus euzebyi]|uniref:RimJ/RimL family protein N-acetyltransferase n=1 Tax=Salirhabdus euzebyi TaxID=394506 RepID=A0A841Q4F9_9BACI|nr:GNAT family N-acetyltransferase [Salirhabdus euzebyi]MBB6453309.1 RimJ/RimL family protein N-acetyltransferase [Salirhabdus euzebyi]
MSIKLAMYEEKYKEKLYDFDLPEEQKQFTGMPRETVDLAVGDQHRHPIVILHNENPIGFFVLHFSDEITDFTTHTEVLLLRAFLIDQNHQGKGYAKEAMLLLPAFVQEVFPEVEEIILVVNERNIAAQQLYKKVGFVDKGFRREGKIGPQYVMHLEMK